MTDRPVLYLGHTPNGLKIETRIASQRTGLPLRCETLTGDSDYYALIADAWQLGRTFLTLEQDIVPADGQLQELLDCPEPWCAYAYDYPPFGVYAGMGAAKFSAELLAAAPEAMAETGGWSDAKHPARHWCRVDGWLKQWLSVHGHVQHVHGTVEHLHAGRPAHDCVTAEDLARLRALAERQGQTVHVPTLSFLVATHDAKRPLWRCLDSIMPQLGRGDEVLVIADTHDGPLDTVRALVQSYDAMSPFGRLRYLELDAGHHDWGHSQRNYGLEHARGEWIHCNDDDDIWAPGAVRIMREAAARSGGRPLLFRFQSYHRGLLFWVQKGVVKRDWIGGHCLVAPNIPGKVGRFGTTYQGDFDWIDSTLKLHGGYESAIWHEEVICIARPASQEILNPTRGWA